MHIFLYLFIIILIIIIFWCLFKFIKEKNLDNNLYINNEISNNIIKHKFDDYEILEIYNILTPEECNILINIAKQRGLVNSEVLTYNKNTTTKIDNSYRNSEQTWLDDTHHDITMKIAKISEKLTGLPRNQQEQLQIAHYNSNGTFKEHFDACVYEDKEYCDKINRYAGQRRVTLLIYLNDDFNNGETEFVDLGLKIKPEIGKGIVFWNTNENDELLVKSKHKGNPVINGEKWIATKWTHVRKYNN